MKVQPKKKLPGTMNKRVVVPPMSKRGATIKKSVKKTAK